MNCEQFELRWNDLLDSRDRDRADPELQEHLRQCVDCRGMAAAQEAILEAIAAWPRPEPSPDLTERVLTQVHASPSFQRGTALKIAAALATAAAIMVACWPALFSTKKEMASRPRRPAQPTMVDLASQPRDAEANISAPPIGLLAQEASARYQDLARETRDWSDLSQWVPEIGVSLSVNEPSGTSEAGTDWVGDVTTGLEPLTQSTSATLRSLLQALPGADSIAVSEERAS